MKSKTGGGSVGAASGDLVTLVALGLLAFLPFPGPKAEQVDQVLGANLGHLRDFFLDDLPAKCCLLLAHYSLYYLFQPAIKWAAVWSVCFLLRAVATVVTSPKSLALSVRKGVKERMDSQLAEEDGVKSEEEKKEEEEEEEEEEDGTIGGWSNSAKELGLPLLTAFCSDTAWLPRLVLLPLLVDLLIKEEKNIAHNWYLHLLAAIIMMAAGALYLPMATWRLVLPAWLLLQRVRSLPGIAL